MVLVQPLADRGVARLARTGIEPTAVVVAHGLIGLAAAALLALRHPAAWWGSALLLQVKTLLDNMDGGLARVTGRVTEAGRYLDTVADLLVNVALFAALTRHGPSTPAWLALVALTLILSLDHNLERRYRTLRVPEGVATPPLPAGAPNWQLTLPRTLYRALLAPQDRLLLAFDDALLRWASGVPTSRAPRELRLAWSDLFSTASIVNLGLSTQLAVLGVLCALGRPYLYVDVVFVQLGWVAFAQVLRVVRMRRRHMREGGVAT